LGSPNAFLIIVGLAVDIAAAFILGKTWPENGLTIAANSLIAIGVWGELWFAKRARDADDSRVAEANERAAKADLARVELEAKLAPRSLTKEQYEILQKLGGKTLAVNIAAEDDLESHWFAIQIASVLQKIGVAVQLFERRVGAHSTSNILCDKNARFNPGGEPTEPLGAILREAGIWNGPLLFGLPGDLRSKASDEIPMLIIGSRWPIPPVPPYTGPTHDGSA
jgi:hypothetical protein